MIKILDSIRKAEHRFDAAMGRFLLRHPFLGYLAVLVGVPFFILIVVFVFTTILALPWALIFGWL